MSYSSELEFATNLLVALNYIASQCLEHHERYPLLTKAICTLLYGVVIQSSGECPHCGGTITIQAEIPVGGLDGALDDLEEALQMLELEVGGEFDGTEDAEEG